MKTFLIGLALVVVVVGGGYVYMHRPIVRTALLTEPQARAIAERSCIKGGQALASGTYDKDTQTWWYEANLNATRPGCTPGCVVSESTRTAQVSWRCTDVSTTTPPVPDPVPVATSPQEVTARIGQKVTALGISITPLEVVQDSRCPLHVQCIWAGTVELKARIESGMGASVMTLKLGESATTEAETITLKSVTPSKSGDPIAPSAYTFVFDIAHRSE